MTAFLKISLKSLPVSDDHQAISKDGILMSAYRPEYTQETIRQISTALKNVLLNCNTSDAPLTHPSQLGLVHTYGHKGELYAVWFNHKVFEKFSTDLQKSWRAVCGGLVRHFLVGKCEEIGNKD